MKIIHYVPPRLTPIPRSSIYRRFVARQLRQIKRYLLDLKQDPMNFRWGIAQIARFAKDIQVVYGKLADEEMKYVADVERLEKYIDKLETIYERKFNDTIMGLRDRKGADYGVDAVQHSHVNHLRRTDKTKIKIRRRQCEERQDCPIQAIATATGEPYEKTYKELMRLSKRTPKTMWTRGAKPIAVHRYLEKKGFKAEKSRTGRYYDQTFYDVLISGHEKITSASRIVFVLRHRMRVANTNDSVHVMSARKNTQGEWTIYDLTYRDNYHAADQHMSSHWRIYGVYYK